MTIFWHVGDEGLVLVHGWRNILVLVVVDVAAFTNLIIWHWSTEVATSLLVGLLVGGDDEVVVVHDWVPEGELHVAYQLEDSVELCFREPASLVRKICTIAHAGGDGVAVKHTGWKLVS